MPRFEHALCMNPYYAESAAAMGFFPPTGLEYVASALATKVPRVTIADLRFDPEFATEAKVHEFIRREGVDLLAVSMNWAFKGEESIGLISRLPADVFTIVGGQEATVQVEAIMRRCPNVDCVARGEAEELVIELADGRELSGIGSLSWRRDGSVTHNDHRTIGPIEALPRRNRSLRRVEYGLDGYGVTILSGGFDTVLTSRGCPFSCKFCSFNRNPFGRKRDYDERTAESVFEEIESVEADIVYFSDDNFFVNHERAEKLCDMIIGHGTRKRFIAQARLELARNPRLLAKLVEAGFKALLLGIESAQDRILKQLAKGFTTAKVREYFRTFRRFDIYYHGYFIYGNIDETRDEMLQIPRFAKELGLDSVSLMKLEARRFTPITDMVEARPDYHVTSGGFVYSDRYSFDELRRIGKAMKKMFYTPMKVARSLAKFIRIGVITPRDLVAYPFSLPVGCLAWLGRRREQRRGRRRRATGKQ
jgi:anaerobic magnesium-protoporphyrin IX monomethyl ester cyclase